LLRVHLVMPEGKKAIMEAIKKWAEISAWDYTLDSAAQWAMSGRGDAPDIFFVHGNVPVLSTGMKGSKAQSVIEKLKEIRMARPQSRILTVFHQERFKDREFLRQIAALGIYDIHLVTAFGEADIKDWLCTARTFADAAGFLGADVPHREVVTDETVLPAQGKTKAARLESVLGNLVRVPLTRGKKGPKPALLTEGGIAYLNGERLEDANLSGIEGLFVPSTWGVQEIKKLRRDARFQAIPLIVTGKGGNNFLEAGADRCVEKITDAVIAETFNLRKRLKQLWSQANIDSLTGCYRRTFWNAWLSEQLRKAKLGTGFAVILVDLDNFKVLNDSEGHQAGDEVLREFGSFLLGNLRHCDISCRYGGEEFIIGCPRTGMIEIRALAERLHRSWEAAGVGPTLSLGVAAYDGGDIVRQADLALYRAKNTGKNRVCVYEPDNFARPEEKQQQQMHVEFKSAVSRVETEAEIEPPQGQPVGTEPTGTPAAEPPEIYQPAKPEPNVALPPRPVFTPQPPRVWFTSHVLTIFSPWGGGNDTTALTVEIARRLNEQANSVVLIDAAFKSPTLAELLGIPKGDLWKFDWRYVETAVGIDKQLFCFPLDPMSKDPSSGYQVPLQAILETAGDLANYVIIDAGDEPEFRAPHDRLLVANKVTPNMLKAWAHWRPYDCGAVIGDGAVLFKEYGLSVLSVSRDPVAQSEAVARCWTPV